MTQAPDQTDSPRGLTYGVATYLMWGFLPLFMKAVAHIPPPEVIAHRVLWSLPIALGVLFWQGRAGQVWEAIRRPRLLAMAMLTAALISINWLIYVWSIANDRAIEAALGYYINPLFSVALGALLLGERLSRLQWAAVALAFAGVATLAIWMGSLPLVAIGLMFSWGFYAFFKRSLPLGPNQGFTLEVMLLVPVALGYALWVASRGEGHFLAGVPTDTLLLLACGPVTAVPLLFYANAAKLVRLSTMGILQYITPTMVFLTAVLVFGEPFTPAQQVAFPMIWGAIILYSFALIGQARARRRARIAPETP